MEMSLTMKMRPLTLTLTKKMPTMKNLIKILFAAAICATLNVSCIKEEKYLVEDANVQVTLSTKASSSSEQGDGIEDVMLWAYTCNINQDGSIQNITQDDPVGWKTVTMPEGTYTSTSVHMQLPMCEGSQSYVIVAVINKGEFGNIVDASGSALVLGRDTKYSALTNAKFANESLINSSITETKNPATPTLMPVSHWATCTVTEANAYPNCLQLDMPVFRAVAKTQFFIAKMSEFDLTVNSLEIYSNKLPEDGVVLSSLAPDQLNNTSATPTPAWLGSATPAATTQGSYTLATNKAVTAVRESRPVIGTGETAYNYYTHIGSHFLHETAEACTNAADYETNPDAVPSGNGFFYKIQYTIGNDQTLTRYVAIPAAIVRNRDYQVQALVKADGQIDVNYIVAEWDDVEWDLDFDAPVHTNLLTEPKVDAQAPSAAPTLYFDNSDLLGEKGAFIGYFMMEGPKGITWKPTLTNTSAGDFEVRVYTHIDNNGAVHSEYDVPVTDANIEAEDGRFYKIAVVAKNQNNIDKVVKLGIAYAPLWNEEANPLLIINNADGDTTYYPWTDNGNNSDAPDMFWISIRQISGSNN